MSTNREHCRQSIESIPGERDLLAVINSNLVIRRSYRFFPGDLRRDDDVTTDPIWRLGLALIVAGADRRPHRHYAFINQQFSLLQCGLDRSSSSFEG